jgi:hypothetical protein
VAGEAKLESGLRYRTKSPFFSLEWLGFDKVFLFDNTCSSCFKRGYMNMIMESSQKSVKLKVYVEKSDLIREIHLTRPDPNSIRSIFF